MITTYIQQKLEEAEFKILEDGTYFGEIASSPWVWANKNSLYECQRELQEVLEEWVILHIAKREKIPGVDYGAIDTTLPEYA
jgi:predicted RNase H-like HicB family nuclease